MLPLAVAPGYRPEHRREMPTRLQPFLDQQRNVDGTMALLCDAFSVSRHVAAYSPESWLRFCRTALFAICLLPSAFCFLLSGVLPHGRPYSVPFGISSLVFLSADSLARMHAVADLTARSAP